MQQPKIIQELFRSKTPINVLYNLKNLNFEASSKKIKQAQGYPLSKKILFQNSFLPKGYAELRKARQLEFSNNLEGELAWLVNGLSIYSKELNNFFQLEKEYQESVLLGDFKKAKTLVNRINSKVCFSYWSIENMFSIEQKLNGTEANWNFLNELNKEIKSSYTQFFNHFYSTKSEAEVSILQYKRSLENLINSNIYEQDLEYIIFKLGYFYFDKFKEYAYFLYSEGVSSVIDKYLILIDVLTELSNKQENNSLLENVINELKAFGIVDERLDRLMEYSYGNSLVNLNIDILNLYDIYTIGDYDKSIDLSIELLKKYPYSIEIYETYIKSLLEKGKGFLKTNVSDSIDFILGKLYSICFKDEKFHESKEALLKEYLCFPRLSFYKQLLSFTLSLTQKVSKDFNGALYFVNSYMSNPQIIFWNENYKRIKFEDYDFDKHISVRVNKFISEKKVEGLRKENLPLHKLKVYESRIGYYFDEEIDIILLNEISDNFSLNNYFYEQNILFLFKANLINKNIEELVKLVVDSFFKNRFLIERLDVSNLVTHIVNSNYQLREITIDLPILFFAEEADTYFLFVTLELFLDTLSLSRPSEIESYINKDKLIYLLYKVCTIDVLNNFYLIYENDDEVIDERIQILKKLAKIDHENQKKYFEEVASLNQKIRIREVIKQVNDGKISLNFSRIKEDKKFSIENSFNRFLKLKGFSEKNELLLVDSQDLILSYLSEIIDESDKLQEAPFVNFKSLFFEVTDLFLFSKEHGLEGDLSTRIRHGVLENQLRSVFKSLHLISTKKSEDEYNNISIWDGLCQDKGYKTEINDEIQKVFKDFSKLIDTLISKIVKNYIQIQSNNHKSKIYGLFNYRITDEYLWILYKEVTDTIDNYEDFISYVFDILTVLTTNSLKNVRNFLEKEVNLEFQNLINALEHGIKKIIWTGEVWSEINQNMNISRTQIERELYNVSKWFKITNINSGALDMDTIIKTAFESINLNFSELEKIVPKIKVPEGYFFERGFYYIDIFRILIANSIEYSGLSLEELDVSIEVENKILYNTKEHTNEPFSKVIIRYENNISEKSDFVKIDKELKKVLVNWKSDLSKVNVEGGSGFQKIKRMLNYDIKVFESDFNYELKNNHVIIELEIINKYNLIDD